LGAAAEEVFDSGTSSRGTLATAGADAQLRECRRAQDGSAEDKPAKTLQGAPQESGRKRTAIIVSLLIIWSILRVPIEDKLLGPRRSRI